MFCPKCGTKLDDGARFCPACGNMFEAAAVDDDTAVQPTDMQAFVPAEEISPMLPSFTQEMPIQSAPQQNTPPMRPAPQQPAQQQPAQQAKKSSHKGLTAFLAVLLTLLVAGSALYYFNPGEIFGSSDDDDSSSKKSKDSSVSQVDDEDDDDDDDDDDSSDDESSQSDDSSETETTTTTTVTTTDEPEETTTTSETTDDSSDPTDTTTSATDDTTTTTGTPGNVDEDEDYNEAMKYSTDEEPDFDEFEWCYGQSDMVTAAPAGAEKITKANRMAGGWKCMIIYSTSKQSEALAREVNKVTIDPTADGVNMTIDWRTMEVPGAGTIPEDTSDDTTFAVSTDSNGKLTGNPEDGPLAGGELVISDFWNDGSHDYAVGEYKNGSFLYGYVALYR